MEQHLKVLLGNHNLDYLAGTETWTYTLAAELRRLGHSVVAFSPWLGQIANRLEAIGVRCVSSLVNADVPNVIICNHHDITMELHHRFPRVPIIATVHGTMHKDSQSHELLPEHPVTDFKVDQYFAVSEEIQGLLLKDYSIESLIVRNFFDLTRFSPSQAPPKATPRTIVRNDNYGTRHDEAHEVIEQVAAHYGADLRLIGANFEETWEIESVLRKSDVVVGMGRSVLEGFCMGKVALVHGRWGTGGVLNQDTYDLLKQTNFSGRNSNGRVASSAEIIEMIDNAIAHPPLGWQRAVVLESHDVRKAATTFIEHAQRLRTAITVDLCCVVLSVGHPPELAAAVQSLLDQSQPIEIVVVNSGGGTAAPALVASPEVRIVELPQRVLPGAARNSGIAATSAPYISFLAADCTAEEGWVRERLSAHRQGAPAVASAVTNPFRRNLAAWTSYISLFSRRMPGVPSESALLYGVSYERGVFERFGLFREDMRGGEDTEFHQRLNQEVEIRWVPAIRTAHRHSRSFVALLRDHYRRGRRSAAAWQQLNGPRSFAVMKNAILRAPSSTRTAWRAANPGERRWIFAAGLLLVFPTIAYAIGSLMHTASIDGEAE